MRSHRATILIALAATVVAASSHWPAAPPATASASYIVQGDDLAEASRAVLEVGGRITHRLALVDAVAADLTPRQLRRLADSPGIRSVVDNAIVTSAARRTSNARTTDTSTSTVTIADEPSSTAVSTFQGYTQYPALVRADSLHAKGLTGRDVTVAVIDSGLNAWPQIVKRADKRNRLLAHYDAIADTELSRSSYSDQNGHGTHVTSVIVDSSTDPASGRTNGVAPDVGLVVVKAFDERGQGTYADVIRGLEYVVSNRERLGVRVLNLSFSAPARSRYWADPLNQAVMHAWRAGIVVVASAGNLGPGAMTVGVPGNVPYVITVGAMTDGYTPDDRSDDRLTTFSAAGPTTERFVKPDVVAPGGHLNAMMDNFARIAKDHPEFHDGGQYFMMSGTSQAAAVASGVVALLLTAEPTLTPDDVKCRLMASAHPAVGADRTLAYSVFRQGAGMIDAVDAVSVAVTGCSNRGMRIDDDLAGVEHYAGFATRDEYGNFSIRGLDSMLWNDSNLWNDSLLWNDSNLWNDSMLWNDSNLWNDSMLWNDSNLWNDSLLWNDSNLWNDAAGVATAPVGVNVWVDQQ